MIREGKWRGKVKEPPKSPRPAIKIVGKKCLCGAYGNRPHDYTKTMVHTNQAPTGKPPVRRS